MAAGAAGKRNSSSGQAGWKKRRNDPCLLYTSAPLNVFLSVFREKGLDITYRQAREPRGLLKVDHIRAILEM